MEIKKYLHFALKDYSDTHKMLVCIMHDGHFCVKNLTLIPNNSDTAEFNRLRDDLQYTVSEQFRHIKNVWKNSTITK